MNIISKKFLHINTTHQHNFKVRYVGYAGSRMFDTGK